MDFLGNIVSCKALALWVIDNTSDVESIQIVNMMYLHSIGLVSVRVGLSSPAA